jgi:hypothetical protein
VWRNRPMQGLIKIRSLKERDCATVAECCRVLPPLRSSLFAPRVARIRGNYLVCNSKEGRRDLSDVMRNNSSRVTFSVRSALTNSTTEFSVLLAPRLCNATLGIFAASKVLVVKWSTSRV